MVDVYGELFCGSRFCHALSIRPALRDCVDVVGEREGDDVGVETVDDGARLCAGPAVRLAKGDGLSALRLPVLREGGVELDVQLARRVIGNVEQRRLCEGGAGQRADERHGESGLHGSFHVKSSCES